MEPRVRLTSLQGSFGDSGSGHSCRAKFTCFGLIPLNALQPLSGGRLTRQDDTNLGAGIELAVDFQLPAM